MFCAGRRAALLALAAGGVIAVCPAIAQQVPQPGSDYRLIQPQPVSASGRIEVLDFFYYGCGYCNELRPRLESWQKRKPEDVVFRHMPVLRRESWAPSAKLFFTLQAMNAERLHGVAYASYHEDDLDMRQESVIAEWASRQGLDAEKFMSIYRSDETRQKVERARKITADYEIQATPSLVVDGKYLIEGSTPKTIPLLDSVIQLAREQRAANK
jgi:thiol:disulfide interchange protein DsbA